MKGFEDIPEPTLAELAELELPDLGDPADADFTANQQEYMDRAQTPEGESPRDRLHRNARDMTRIEHDTQWAFLSRQGSFLGPKEARDKEKEKSA